MNSTGSKETFAESRTLLFFYSSDDDFRGSTTTLTQSTAPSFGVNQIQPSSSMPWLGSGQTSTGAGVVSTFVACSSRRLTFFFFLTVLFSRET